MRISHRTRLSLATSAVSGVILAILFTASAIIFRSREVIRAHDFLRQALLQLTQASPSKGLYTDLGEIVNANPQLSFGTFDSKGRMVASGGALSLVPTFKWAVSMAGKPTNSSGIEWGIIELGETSVVIGSKSTTDGFIVGVVPWGERARTLAVADIALFILWFPLVGLVGVITWIASARTFLPLSNLAEQAELFSESDLSRRLQISSDDEYAVFAGRLNSFLDRLEDSVKRQQRFVEDAAHELRTPLTILRGRIETSLLSERSGDEYRETLVQVLRETERVSRLVEAMLQSALPVGEVTAPLDLESTLERAHARWLDRYVQSDVQLELETIPVNVVALEEEVDCVIDNLLSNALRSSPKGSTCTISLQMEGKKVLLAVTDEGTGVPIEKREAIFDRFTRLEKSRNRSLGGFGVGLAVCKRLVEARDGTILVTDGPTGGARFEVRWNAAS